MGIRRFLIGVFLLFSGLSFAVCQDSGTSQTCHVGPLVACCPGNWTHYEDAALTLHGGAVCAARARCTCGVSAAGGPCNACGFQSSWSDAFCFSDNGCTSACGGIPEIPAASTPFLYAVAVFTSGLYAWRKRRKQPCGQA